MVTRKKTIPATPFVETVHAEAQTVPQATEPVPFKVILRNMLDTTFGKDVCSIRRYLVSQAVGLVLGAVGGWLAGQALAYMIVGAAVLSGSAFIALCAGVIAAAIVVYATFKVSDHVVRIICDHSIDTALGGVTLAVKHSAAKARSWFGSTQEVAA